MSVHQLYRMTAASGMHVGENKHQGTCSLMARQSMELDLLME